MSPGGHTCTAGSNRTGGFRQLHNYPAGAGPAGGPILLRTSVVSCPQLVESWKSIGLHAHVHARTCVQRSRLESPVKPVGNDYTFRGNGPNSHQTWRGVTRPQHGPGAARPHSGPSRGVSVGRGRGCGGWLNLEPSRSSRGPRSGQLCPAGSWGPNIRTFIPSRWLPVFCPLDSVKVRTHRNGQFNTVVLNNGGCCFH